ncbi:hypothetical protein [Sphingomonas leidyi]|jgi:hypothetical protein|uniref:hypothetical protein n=1 Tax=Sphingomonas leidyi TaxID=68569 RepID=UPI0036D208D3
MTEAVTILDPAAEGVRLEALAVHAQRRVSRAAERRDRANREVIDAFDALEVANSRLAAWRADNHPNPGLLEALYPEGEPK